jgi:hypothetical protein
MYTDIFFCPEKGKRANTEIKTWGKDVPNYVEETASQFLVTLWPTNYTSATFYLRTTLLINSFLLGMKVRKLATTCLEFESLYLSFSLFSFRYIFRLFSFSFLNFIFLIPFSIFSVFIYLWTRNSYVQVARFSVHPNKSRSNPKYVLTLSFLVPQLITSHKLPS